jgi:carotenoid cleavage dioxygenase-like enzyme
MDARTPRGPTVDPNDGPAGAPPLGFRTQRETVDDVALPVEGSIPGWLRGTFLLNGPGQFEVGGRELVHWFDALALVRRFRIDGSPDGGGTADRRGDGRPSDGTASGTIRYASRFVESDDFRWARRRGRLRTATVGTPADRSLPTRLRQTLGGEFLDNPAIGFVRLGDDVLAVTESPHGLRIAPDSLATTGRVDMTAGLDCDVTLGHVHYDPDREAFVGLGVSYGRDRGYVLFRRPADSGVPTAIARLPFDDVPYVHTFALTERYAVVPEVPFGLDATRLLLGAATGTTFLDAFEARPGPTRFHVVDRKTGDRVAAPATGPTFVYHHANAYEVDAAGAGVNPVGKDADGAGDGRSEDTGGRVGEAAARPHHLVVDLVEYPDERAVTGLTVAGLRSGEPDVPPGDLVRYRLPLGDGGGWADREVLREGPVEFPTINYGRYNGRPYRYVYLAELGDGALPERLVKVDVEADAAVTWAGREVAEGGADAVAHPSEATFVPHPEPDAEDDGVLLSLVLDPAGERSVLVVLDAASMSELARAELPQWTPYPFHGQFYDDRAPVRTMQ